MTITEANTPVAYRISVIVREKRLKQLYVAEKAGYTAQEFHDHSYGFRPNRCAQQAILTALDMMNEGNDWIVDIDLEKFFDTVNHDKLMTMSFAINKERLTQFGLVSMIDYYTERCVTC